ncbi:HAD family hydrolase [Merismopedia glauca]|uniref:Haloacid dehalogenase n=2 Tax=Merismopedia TaxID=53402 RepID=A0A2T1C2G0_9CYAN|nr:haloacid dehalogenase [Merismopedia glauca]PSB02449.1 haloacid dehalogenase [Merismopedia glauca CCAP 1448/3]
MLFSQPTILALDFDGVICNGMSEYLATSWQTYGRIWGLETSEMPDSLGDRFSKFRPLIETGWEMPVLIRALILNIPETEITQNWSSVCQNILDRDHLTSLEIAKQLDGLRDEWIERDVDSWLALHEFYPGIVERLKGLFDSPTKLVIITTKEGRFVDEILNQQAIRIDRINIFGKEQKRPKSATLKQLIAQNQDEVIWFVEDRYQTLQKIVANPDLVSVKLYLADWGYNTARERQLARIDSKVKLISLVDFSQDFSQWDRDQL